MAFLDLWDPGNRTVCKERERERARERKKEERYWMALERCTHLCTMP